MNALMNNSVIAMKLTVSDSYVVLHWSCLSSMTNAL